MCLSSDPQVFMYFVLSLEFSLLISFSQLHVEDLWSLFSIAIMKFCHKLFQKGFTNIEKYILVDKK